LSSHKFLPQSREVTKDQKKAEKNLIEDSEEKHSGLQ
jgi:hypothetical protein